MTERERAIVEVVFDEIICPSCEHYNSLGCPYAGVNNLRFCDKFKEAKNEETE